MTQLSFIDAIHQRDVAITQVVTHAEEHVPNFIARAQAYVLAVLALQAEATSEELTAACISAGITAHDKRAFGGVYLSLSRAGKIRKVGTAPRVWGHGTSGGSIWALCVSQEGRR